MFEIDLSHDEFEPLVFVPVTPSSEEPLPYPAQYRDQIMVDVIHDGRYIPPAFMIDRDGHPIDPDLLHRAYVTERDWGAAIIAQRVCERLGLPGFYKVNTARCLLDFGRFPGSTQPHASHLRRFAINHPFSQALSYAQKRRLLEEQYDVISSALDQALRGKRFKIALHTYDRLNPSGTTRPQVSLITRSLSYQENSEMPFGVFDPLYPDILAEFTTDRILRDRISLTLEKAGIPVAHNYPYLLPEGSPEVRHQVLAFFTFLKQRFELTHPETRAQPAYQRVWEMLTDTNLRSAEAGDLRGVLHMYRRPPQGRRAEFERTEIAYQQVKRFLHTDEMQIVEEYRFLDDRPNSLGIEVRKDLVWTFDAQTHPVRPSYVRAWYIADAIADAITVYLNEDRAPAHLSEEDFNQHDPWYVDGDVPDGRR